MNRRGFDGSSDKLVDIEPGDIVQISGRIIHDRVKAMLIDAEIGVLDFSQAMIQFLLVPGSDGQPETMSDYVIGHQDQLSQGKIDLTYRLPPGRP